MVKFSRTSFLTFKISTFLTFLNFCVFSFFVIFLFVSCFFLPFFSFFLFLLLSFFPVELVKFDSQERVQQRTVEETVEVGELGLTGTSATADRQGRRSGGVSPV